MTLGLNTCKADGCNVWLREYSSKASGICTYCRNDKIMKKMRKKRWHARQGRLFTS